LKAVRRLTSRQFFRYLVSGTLAASTNFFSRFAFRLLFSFGASVMLAYTAGAVVSFSLHRAYTFRTRHVSAHAQAARFTLVALLGIPLSGWLAEGALRALQSVAPGLAPARLEALAHLASLAGSTVYGYLAMKHFSFKTRPAETPVSAASV
jgi:putative flippase GtrA